MYVFACLFVCFYMFLYKQTEESAKSYKNGQVDYGAMTILRTFETYLATLDKLSMFGS